MKNPFDIPEETRLQEFIPDESLPAGDSGRAARDYEQYRHCCEVLELLTEQEFKYDDFTS